MRCVKKGVNRGWPYLTCVVEYAQPIREEENKNIVTLDDGLQEIGTLFDELGFGRERALHVRAFGVTNWQNPFSSCRHTPFLCRSARFTLDALVCWRSRNSHIPATMSHPECRY